MIGADADAALEDDVAIASMLKQKFPAAGQGVPAVMGVGVLGEAGGAARGARGAAESRDGVEDAHALSSAAASLDGVNSDYVDSDDAQNQEHGNHGHGNQDHGNQRRERADAKPVTSEGGEASGDDGADTFSTHSGGAEDTYDSDTAFHILPLVWLFLLKKE